jgi:ABC-type transport system substrate-binding protein
MLKKILQLVCSFGVLCFVGGCTAAIWNNPYPAETTDQTRFYSSFSERPKHLDPARSYGSSEWAFISQIYEPLLQYHYLARPYQLVPLSASQMPVVHYLDTEGQQLPHDVDPSLIAFSEYLIDIQPGIRFQPHPAFAKTETGAYRYWPLSPTALNDRFVLSDFEQTGSRELLADDYIYQIKRLALVRNHSPIAGLMADYIVGFADFAEQANQQVKQNAAAGKPWTDLRPLSMSGVKRLGKYQFSIRINRTYPQFKYWLAMNFFAPMPWEAERFYAQPGMSQKNLNLNWYPVGTGPFMLTENNPNLRMVLSRNPYFRGELYPDTGSETQRAAGLLADAGQPMPFIDQAVYSLEKEAIPRWNKFLQGYYDNAGISSDSFDEAIQFAADGTAGLTDPMRAQGIQLSTAVQTSIHYMGFNMLDPVIGGKPKDPADQQRARLLRRSIAMAIDWEDYISIFQNGRGEVAHSILPPGIFGYQSGEAGLNPYTHRWQNGQAQRRSLAEAQALLAKAGYPNGRDSTTGKALILYYDTGQSGPGSQAVMQWYTQQLAKLGIQLVIRSSDYNRFREKMRKGDTQIFSWGWNADYPDPENFLFLLYGPQGKVNYQGENAANFQHPEFDQLFEQMKNLPDGPVRQGLIKQMIEILRAESPWLFGFFPKGFSLHHAWYHNALPHLMANNTLKYKRIDNVLRTEQQQAWNQPVVWPLILLGLGPLILLMIAIKQYRARERSRANLT